MASLVVPAGLPRVGLVHGPVGVFDEDGVGRTVDGAGASDLALDYLALGDFHRQQQVDGMPAAAWYSGTHEPDRFPTHGQADERHGLALLVDVPGPGVAPIVSPLSVPEAHVWVRLRMSLGGSADLDRLTAELERLARGRAQSTLCQIDIDGSVLGCAERDRLDRILTEAAPHFLVLDRRSLRCQPNEAELASLAARSGVVGSVAGALARRLPRSSGADAEIARAALVQLYLLTAQNA